MLEVRGFGKLNGVLYAVGGEWLFSVDAGGGFALVPGASISGNGPVRITANRTHLFITPGDGSGYYSDGATLNQELDPDWTVDGGGADVVSIDGYLVARRPGSPSFINSGVEAITWNGLDIASANGGPGNLVGLIVNNRELILAKEGSTECWYDAANQIGTPFTRSPDGFKEIGCAASGSLISADNSPVMLSNQKTFVRLGQVWQRISQYGIESVLQRLAVHSDCIALPYVMEGHSFVAWSFPSDGRTLVVDFSTGEWHERASIRADGSSIGAWRVQAIIECYGKTFVGDRISGKIGVLDPDTHTEWDDPQVMSWTYSPVYAEGMRASHRRLELGFAAGQGTATGDGEDPKITLFVSDDGGNTERARPTRALGRLGQYSKRVVYDNLGESTNRVYRFQMSDPVRQFTLDTQLDVEGAR